jgi:hypothetical protein
MVGATGWSAARNVVVAVKIATPAVNQVLVWKIFILRAAWFISMVVRRADQNQ